MNLTVKNYENWSTFVERVKGGRELLTHPVCW